MDLYGLVNGLQSVRSRNLVDTEEGQRGWELKVRFSEVFNFILKKLFDDLMMYLKCKYIRHIHCPALYNLMLYLHRRNVLITFFRHFYFYNLFIKTLPLADECF
jgi:phage anti-repressor protein